MDLAFVENVAKEKNGAEYLLVSDDLLDRTVDAKGMKTVGSKETVKAFSIMNKKIVPKKIKVKSGLMLLEDLKEFEMLKD